MGVALRGDVGPAWPLSTAAGVILMTAWRGLRCVGLAQEAGFSGGSPLLHPHSAPFKPRVSWSRHSQRVR